MRSRCSPSQSRVDHPAGERAALGALARLAALDGILQPPAGFLIVQQLRPPFRDDLADDLGHRVQVVEHGHRSRGVQASEVGLRPTAILRRTSAATADADRIGLADLRLHPAFDADLVAPGSVQVVFVDKPSKRRGISTSASG